MAEKSTQNEIYQTLSKLRDKYTDDDDLERIDADFKRIKDLFKAKGLADNEAVQDLAQVCRADILFARTRLASDRKLIGDEKAQRELWFLIESREWFLKIVSRDFESEISSIENELIAELDK